MMTMRDDSLGCAAALWVVWRWVTGGDGGCLSWMLMVGILLAAIASLHSMAN